MSQSGSVTAAPTAPYRIRPPVVRDAITGPCGTENGPVVYERLALAQAERVAVATQDGSNLKAAGGNGHRRKRAQVEARSKKHRDSYRNHGANPTAKKANLLAEKLLHDMS